ncbi:hypothetical protein HYU22_05550 [Candidatus Woesearchaeota archaeon]|nr:hypothetical protein [Candidatus Woesearchaeota archaeon]
MEWADKEIRGKVLHKLSRFGKFQHSHTAIEHLQKGFPPHLGGRVKENIHELKKEGILLSKPTNYGEQVSINVEMTEKVMEYITIFLKRKE